MQASRTSRVPGSDGLGPGGETSVLKLRADRVSAWVAHVLENAQRLMPGRGGRGGFPGRMEGIAQMHQYRRPLLGDEGVSLNLHGLLIAGDGLVIVAELMVNVAETVQSGGLGNVVFQFAL